VTPDKPKRVRKPKIVKPAPEVQVKPPAEMSLVEVQGAPVPNLHDRPGQPTKRTPERRKAILQALEFGTISRTKAAQAVGISRDTLHEWLVNDPAFSDECDEAEGRAVVRNAGNIAVMARRDPKMALEVAKHNDREHWEDRPIRIDVRVIAARVAVELGLSGNQAEAIIEEMKRLTEPEGY
jgi:hypothetical protein